jgi:hypothetical protein
MKRIAISSFGDLLCLPFDLQGLVIDKMNDSWHFTSHVVDSVPGPINTFLSIVVVVPSAVGEEED